nr:MAG: MatK/TrnK amino terminal region [Bacteriophage sp.]
MKRYSHPIGDSSHTLWDAICSMDNLKLAHQNAKKGKGWYKEVKMVDENPDYYFGLLQEMLINHTYKTSEYQTFYKTDSNKKRLIFKLPYFPDRICQWAVLQVIEPIILKNFTADTYSAIPDRGIHKCLAKLQDALQNDVKGSQYCLKIDAKQYYPSIDHHILKMKYRRLFKDADLLWLLDEIIDSTPGDKGIPIGNYLSQWSGNFYLSSFDHWIKEVKGIKHYFRYMDDIVILHESKEYLHQLRKEIDAYFQIELKLTIKENWQVFPTYKRGIDFVGYRSFLNYTLLRKSTCKNFKVKMVAINKKRLNGKSLTYSEWCSINSYKGWLKHCNSYRLQIKYLKPLEQYADNYYNQNIKMKG